MQSIYDKTKPEEAIINYLKRHGYTTEKEESITLESLTKAILFPDKGAGSRIFRNLDLNENNLEVTLQSLVHTGRVKLEVLATPPLLRSAMGETYKTYSAITFKRKHSKKKNKYLW